MAGFVRRFTEIQTIEVIRQIEGVVIIDLAPPDPATGAGSGSVLLVGEFEDGFFANDAEVKGAVEVFGSEDFRQKFGGFGFTYSGTPAQNPSARRHLQELWNGNGFIKAFKLRAQRLMVSRVDTNVGTVSFDPLACLDGGVGPFVVPNSTAIAFTTDQGGGSSTAITGTVATVAGAGAAFGTIASGDSFQIRVDGGPVVTVTFGAADTTQAAVISRINATLGYTAAVANVAEVDLVGIVPGTDGSIQLIDSTPGVLAKIGHVAATTAGTGNVGNLNAVTVTEIVTIINGSAALAAINVTAVTGPEGQVRVCNSSPAAASTIEADAAGNGDVIGLEEGTTVGITDHPGGTIPAGTRVSDGSLDWVTMQSLDIPEGELGPYVAKVRPALDDGTQAGAGAGTVTTIKDAVDFAQLVVTNPNALSAALDENQLDSAYTTALNATLDESGVCREANYLLIARRSDAVVRDGKSNALKATACGLFARKFITGDPLGTDTNTILANVAKFRSDRVFYTGKGLKIRIPQIAEVGSAGGLGFTDTGIITVRPDGPLTTLCALLAPEENPGQQTGLIDDFFEVDSFGEVLDVDTYKAYRREGVAVPRVDRVSGTIFQSGLTSSLQSGRRTMARRKMADFIQDTATELLNPYVKRLSKQSRRTKVRAVWEQFLAALKSEQNPELSRIEDFSVDDSINAGNTPEVLAQGVYYLQTVVRTFASLDDIVVQTEIGENAIVVTAN